jgi:hypothetical protein
MARAKALVEAVEPARVRDKARDKDKVRAKAKAKAKARDKAAMVKAAAVVAAAVAPVAAVVRTLSPQIFLMAATTMWSRVNCAKQQRTKRIPNCAKSFGRNIATTRREPK